MNALTRADNILLRIEELASCSEDPSCITRRLGSEAFIEASSKISAWMKAAGLTTIKDNIGNVRGRWECSNPAAKTFVIGSHFDSVTDAGKFDGPLGIIMAIDYIENLMIKNITLPFHIECIAFSDEEGVRFHTTYLGSKVLAGTFETNLLSKVDSAEITLAQTIKKMGGNIAGLSGDAMPVKDWFGYFEIHIEQGPVLYEKNIPVAIVTGIAAQKRIEVLFLGTAGHAGTVPMNMRHDALCAAAECIVEIEAFAAIHMEKFVATIGMLTIPNSASNVIPGKVNISLDLRSIDEDILDKYSSRIKALLEQICSKRNIGSEWKIIQESSSVNCDRKLNDQLKKAISANGFEVIELVSGAGHDAVAISKVAPVSMLFVRCFEGISHNPLEHVEKKDIAAAILVGDSFLEILTGHSN